MLQITNIASLSLMIFPAYRARSVIRSTQSANHIAQTLSPHTLALAHFLRIGSFVLAITVSIVFVWALWRDLTSIRRMPTLMKIEQKR